MRDKILRSVVRGALATTPIARVIGRKRIGTDPALDPQVAAVLELYRLMKLPALESMEPRKARRFAAEGLSPLDAEQIAMARITDVTAPGKAGPIPIRLYVPPDAGPDWIVYFHGGGGVIGSVAASEPATRLIAARTRCTVASVDYRLGPEHKHPAAIDDASDAFDAIASRVPARGKIAVAGDSFGGFLSAHVDRRARARGVRAPDAQALLYPMVDLAMTSPSIDRHAHGYFLTRSLISWFHANYLHESDDPRAASPLFWSGVHDLAPAVIVTAAFDPLVDEGDAYARRLADAGVPVRHRRHDSLVHGFISMSGAVRAARAAVEQMCDDITQILATGA